MLVQPRRLATMQLAVTRPHTVLCRYSDFKVNEIDTTGRVVQLTSLLSLAQSTQCSS